LGGLLPAESFQVLPYLQHFHSGKQWTKKLEKTKRNNKKRITELKGFSKKMGGPIAQF